MSKLRKKWEILFWVIKKMCTNLSCLGFNLTKYSFFPKILTGILVATWTLLLNGTIRFPSPKFFSTWYLIRNTLLPLSTSFNLFWLCSSICILKHFAVLFEQTLTKFIVSAICFGLLLVQHRFFVYFAVKTVPRLLFLCYMYFCCFCKSYYSLCWKNTFFLQNWVRLFIGWNCCVTDTRIVT